MDRDVTAEPDYWGGYAPNAQYEIVSPIFVVGDAGAINYLFGPNVNTNQLRVGDSQALRTPTLDEYKRDLAHWKFINGVIESGNHLSVRKFQLHETYASTTLSISAEILDGEFKGRLVLLETISLKDGNSNEYSLAPNRKYLVPLHVQD